MKLLNHPSPNWNERPGGAEDVDTVTLHATADQDTAAAVTWCCTPAPKNPKPVSYHTIVDRDASVIVLVSSTRRAWHAGRSLFHGRADVNDFSIGLSFANRNDGVEPYPPEQLAVGAALVAGWMKRYPKITLDRITTHAAIRSAWRVTHPEAEIKTDPAPPAFDLDKFRLTVMRELTGAGGCI
jgi:N-acetylmuramoyl-L-alanine amidase